jgi:oxalate decarboxylase/phosphoglucose isomerase-like protein (cupin superfamily)
VQFNAIAIRLYCGCARRLSKSGKEDFMSENKLSAEQFEKIDFPGGVFYRANQKRFKALRGLAVQKLDLKPGAVREPHSHPNAEQLDYCISGTARVGIVGPEGHKQLLDLKEGDISFVPRGYIHWIENTGKSDLLFLVVLSHEQPETVELSETLVGVPADTLGAALGISSEAMKAFPKSTVTISSGSRL